MAIQNSKLTSGAVVEVGDAHNSGVNWEAVFAGALVAVILTVLLLILGVGLGFSSISPWTNDGISIEALGVSTLIWLALTQLLASSAGGYMAGRLRVKWSNVSGDEVHFRDTAHGLLAWSVATLFTFTVLLGSVQQVLGGALNATKDVSSAAISNLNNFGKDNSNINGDAVGSPASLDYFADIILRADSTLTESSEAGLHHSRSEVTRILVTSLYNSALLPEDRTYLASIVAKRNGITVAEAEEKIDTVYSRITQAKDASIEEAKQAAEKARKLATHTTLWLFVDLLLGAFIASLFATFGGRLRDDKNIYSA